MISGYIALRFEWKYAVPVLIALMHDLLITARRLLAVGREVTTSTVAALLTILGYSLYDTIIVFDRVRENVPRMPRAAFSQIVNRSMSEVLTRSLATSFCTLLPILALLFFGGETLKDFAFALLVGVALRRVLVDLHRVPGAHALEGARAGLAQAPRPHRRWRTTASCPPTPTARRRRRDRGRAGGAQARRAGGSPRPTTRTGRSRRTSSRRWSRDLGLEEDGRSSRRPRPPSRRPAARQRRGPDPRGPRPEGRAQDARSRSGRAIAATGGRPPMGVLAWIMMGIAIWHFAIFMPDRFWGGIVGAFVGALVGAVIFGLHRSRASRSPANDDIHAADRARGDPRRRCSASRAAYGIGVAPGATCRASDAAAARGSVVPAAYGAAVDERPLRHRALRRSAQLQRALERRSSGVRRRRSRRCSCRRGLGDPDAARGVPRGRRARTTRRRSRASTTPVALILGHVAARLARSSSTATTTATASARRRSSCARCATLGARRRLVPAEPLGGRLRARRGDRRAAGRARARRCSSRPTAAITAVEEVARARELGLDVVVTDHHQPRADGALPGRADRAPAGLRLPVRGPLRGRRRLQARARRCWPPPGRDPALADRDLDLVALATVADCVPLRGENRRLVRAGPARRSSQHAARGPARADARRAVRPARASTSRPSASASRRGSTPPGRLQRADAGRRAAADRGRGARAARSPTSSTRPTRERRARRDAHPVRGRGAGRRARASSPAYVLAGEDWHPGVIGIVASRLAERHHRPGRCMIALDGERGHRLGPLDPRLRPARRPRRLRASTCCATAATAPPPGCTVAARRGRRAARRVRRARRGACSTPADLVPAERVDAVVAGEDTRPRRSPRSSGGSRRSASATRGRSLLVPAARMTDARTMGEGKHVRFTVERRRRAAPSAVAFGARPAARRPRGRPRRHVRLEINRWNGAEEPRLVLRAAAPPRAGADRRRPGAARRARPARRRRSRELDAPLERARRRAGRPRRGVVRDRRGAGIAGDARARSSRPASPCSSSSRAPSAARAALHGPRSAASRSARGTSWSATPRWPMTSRMSSRSTRRCCRRTSARCGAPARGRTTHLAWGAPELRFTEDVLEHDAVSAAGAHGALPRPCAPRRERRSSDVLLARPGAAAHGRARRAAAARPRRARPRRRRPRRPAPGALPPAERTELERSPAFRADAARLQEGRAWLSRASSRAA